MAYQLIWVDIALQYLEELKSKKVHIIIGDMVEEAARDVMCQAYHLKMTAHEGYVWFLPRWLAPDWYDTVRYKFRDCTTQQMIHVSPFHL